MNYTANCNTTVCIIYMLCCLNRPELDNLGFLSRCVSWHRNVAVPWATLSLPLSPNICVSLYGVFGWMLENAGRSKSSLVDQSDVSCQVWPLWRHYAGGSGPPRQCDSPAGVATHPPTSRSYAGHGGTLYIYSFVMSKLNWEIQTDIEIIKKS